jgi:ribonuclease VapC
VNSVVLDASAVLAVLNIERGHEKVIPHLSGGLISAVNYSEVLKKSVESGTSLAAVNIHLQHFMLDVVPFDVDQARLAAEIWPAVRKLGLSFADRACLTLGLTKSAAVLTGDKNMTETDLPVKVKLFRDRH